MISIITSTHKRPEKLKRAIESVLAQSFQDFEMIIVNDEPDEETRKVVSSFNDKRLRYIAMPGKYGCDTRPKNIGIKESKREYIAFLDDDNSYRTDHLQSLLKEIETSGVDVVYGDRWIYDGDKPVSIGIFHDPDPFLMMRRNYIDTSDVLCKREAILEVGGFDERYKKYVDWNLWVRMMKAGYTFKRVPLILTDYHIYQDSKSGRKEDEKGFSQPAWDAFNCEIQVGDAVKEPRVAIFSITYDRLEMTKKSFESLHKTAKYPFKHFIVDNGSTDGTQEWLKTYDGDITLNPDNKGISIASNQAIEKMKDYDIIVKVDNDALFITEGWLKRMVAIWKSNRMIVLSPYIQGLKDNPGGAPREDYGVVCNEYLGLTRHIGGIVHFADSKAYKEFRWDETDTLHGLQDLELSMYLNKHGYLHAYMENYYCEHMYGTEGQHKMFPDYFERRTLEKTTTYEKNK